MRDRFIPVQSRARASVPHHDLTSHSEGTEHLAAQRVHIRERNHAVSVDERLAGVGWKYTSPVMAEVVNLRRARKSKERAAAENQAQANRVSFGRTKAEKKKTQAENDAARRNLEGHKRDDD